MPANAKVGIQNKIKPKVIKPNPYEMPKLLKLSKTPKVKNVEDAINIKLKTVDRAGSKLRMKFLSQLGIIIFLLKFLSIITIKNKGIVYISESHTSMFM